MDSAGNRCVSEVLIGDLPAKLIGPLTLTVLWKTFKDILFHSKAPILNRQSQVYRNIHNTVTHKRIEKSVSESNPGKHSDESPARRTQRPRFSVSMKHTE